MFPRFIARQSSLSFRSVPSRSIAFLNNGSRIRGLKRDPASYMKNPNGLEYNSINKIICQDKVRSILEFDKYNIQLSDEIILQCLTHKSFAHGKVPYNEKLYLLGAQFLKLRTSIHSLKNGNSSNPINGMHFTNLGEMSNKTLSSKQNITNLIKNAGIDDIIFWKMRDPTGTSKLNGEDRVIHTVLNSLIGAILTTNGSQTATKYVDDFLLNKDNKLSLINSATQ
ncbi:similar to Saccharomyces cerevisiae YLR312W-A MRPL15 Mitochondrial ribosomal protein of the large subunit [Maudiozyma barnettii]|uniref:Similar to Saccharomyces cerevisiae YLR312W-A MRPL15 Mitochondrial ribosomal protein of the large subunit n=1 Tax=Maudiozyma barnettii TaxID=61262 RepID=A0A8H2VD14_9SACH|nr:mitochondrial 54S ribosomal protein YmL15 [Kazachstania barnettii]CAB4253008.1 similar to Saccharomyces cerevisiae YLR312W-A MRPL15 Mitochondrial ribosomal protein of the large subunit [Kazachstania barnettii]CAD1780140.1 similar to Saccharomyces cerevisiae YLR312W-A MRPL15 Mitochondrial ribosomal protein of the large subunit [Kazachstania barnettii]